MKACFRTFAALLALLAFSASFAEGVWASTCGSMGPMTSMSTTSSVHMETDGSHAPQHHSESATSGHGVSSPAPGCPLIPVLGGCTAVFFPPAETTVAFSATTHAKLLVVLDRTPNLLLVSALLRPPRA
jgi:hypothetical protein